MGPSRAGDGWVARAIAQRAFSGHISLLREGEDVWSWFPAAETTSQAAVPTEPEAAQTRLGPMRSRGLGDQLKKSDINSYHKYFFYKNKRQWFQFIFVLFLGCIMTIFISTKVSDSIL